MTEYRIAVSAVTVAALLILGAPVASAQNYYMDVHVGYNIVDSGDLEYAAGTSSVGYEQRPAFGGSFGYFDPSGMRIEGELTYRNNDIDYVGGVRNKGNLAGLGLMVNAIYELQIGGGYGYGRGSDNPLRPYIGVGGGGVRYTINSTDNLAAADVVDDMAYALAYQGIVGVGVAVSETALISLDFRYVVSDNVKFADVAGNAFEMDVIQASAMFGLRTLF